MTVADTVVADAAMVHALADELVLASGLLSELAYDLGSDDAVLRRHITSLQAVDHVTQLQLAVSSALRLLACGANPVEDITLADMRERVVCATQRGAQR